MSYDLLYALSVILLNVSLLNSSPFFEDYDDPMTAQKYSQFNCFKKKFCTPGPPKVCGFDIRTKELAEFEDKCTYYRINCEGGFFKLVDMLACESKKSFAALQNSTDFDWHHINHTDFNWEHINKKERAQEGTIKATTTVLGKVIPGLVQLVLNKML